MKIPTIWHDSYHQPGAASWLSTRKQREVMLACEAEGFVERIDGAEPEWESIARVHDPEYVNAVRTGEPRLLAESQGFDWSAEWAESVARIWASHAHAARQDRPVVFHPVSGAHHATRERGDGFCTFNYLVGAARAALEAGRAKSVMIADLDTHQGNGNFELASDDRILQFDISGASFGIAEIDEPRRFYRLVRNADEYRDALARLPAMLDLRPSLVLYQAGMDCWERDGMGGVRGMSEAALAERDRFVFTECRERKIPVVFNLAGGYVAGGETVRLHVNTVRIATEVFA